MSSFHPYTAHTCRSFIFLKTRSALRLHRLHYISQFFIIFINVPSTMLTHHLPTVLTVQLCPFVCIWLQIHSLNCPNNYTYWSWHNDLYYAYANILVHNAVTHLINRDQHFKKYGHRVDVVRVTRRRQFIYNRIESFWLV